LVSLAVKFLEIALDALVNLLEGFRELVLGKVALFGIDRFALAAVESDEFTREEVQPFAQHCELPADLPQRHQVVLTDVRHRLVIRAQLL
jgi:hypothetical protein